MLTSPITLVAFVAVAFYFGWWKASLERRKRASWDSLIGRLRKDCVGRELSAHFLWREGLSAGPDETWNRMGGLRGAWSMFKNAQVMMEMADFAARNCAAIDAQILDTLRSDAAQIRLCVIGVAFGCVLHAADESVRMQAFRAASIYTGMAARLTDLLQTHAEGALPQFVAAM